MINYLKSMKIKYPTLSHEKKSSMDSEAGVCRSKNCIGKRSFPYSNCIIIAIPVLSFLALGIYFILVDLKILASVLNSASLNGTAEVETVTESEVLILVEEDVNRTDWSTQQTSTTQKVFVYSPTVPQLPAKEVAAIERGKEEATTKEESIEGANCFSTRLALCEGISPYDLVQLPDGLNATSTADVDSIYERFQRLIDSECSWRVRDTMCAVLEPECRPDAGRQVFPCRSNCQVVADECKDVIAADGVLSEIFDCHRNENWDSTADCVDLFRGMCRDGDYQCPEGQCIPHGSVCDGLIDCPGSGSDEMNCPKCPEASFRCETDSTCLPMMFVCDGVSQCSDNSDEASC